MEIQQGRGLLILIFYCFTYSYTDLTDNVYFHAECFPKTKTDVY